MNQVRAAAMRDARRKAEMLVAPIVLKQRQRAGQVPLQHKRGRLKFALQHLFRKLVFETP